MSNVQTYRRTGGGSSVDVDSGVASLNGLNGALSITSTGGTVTITPSGSTIDIEAAAGGAVHSKSAPYLMLTTDSLVIVDTTGGPVTITLPASPTVGKIYMVKKVSADANAVTVTPSAGTIDGGASFMLTVDDQAISTVYDGTNWWIV